MFERLRNLLATATRNRRPEVELTFGGMTVTNNGQRKFVNWWDINRVAAFRRDIYLGVVVCLALEIEDGWTLHVIEGDPDWLRLISSLDKKLPGALHKEQWFSDVAAGNKDVVLIYDRAKAVAPC